MISKRLRAYGLPFGLNDAGKRLEPSLRRRTEERVEANWPKWAGISQNGPSD